MPAAANDRQRRLAAERQRRRRALAKNGRAALVVTINYHLLAEKMIEIGALAEHDAEDRTALADALGRRLDAWAAE